MAAGSGSFTRRGAAPLEYARTMSAPRMDVPEGLDDFTAERSWTTEGPNSGGYGGWFLHQGHMFQFHNEGSSGSISRGIPVAEWIEGWAEHHPEIVAQLRARDT